MSLNTVFDDPNPDGLPKRDELLEFPTETNERELVEAT
jgi:hypothetical protein